MKKIKYLKITKNEEKHKTPKNREKKVKNCIKNFQNKKTRKIIKTKIDPKITYLSSCSHIASNADINGKTAFKRAAT